MEKIHGFDCISYKLTITLKYLNECDHNKDEDDSRLVCIEQLS